MRLKQTMNRRFLLPVILSLLNIPVSFSINRVSIASGNWNASATWSPSGSPSPSDNITIASGHTITINTSQTVHHVTVNQGSILEWASSNILSVTGNLTVNGTVKMNGGNISLTNYGLAFILGNNSVFTWEPGTNTAAGATLFTNGIESFSPTSTLIIKKWYNFTVPLPSVVTGNFGNLELNTYNGTAIPEWNQNNGFQTHQVLGTLTIDAGWITLDKSGSISNTTIGKILLKNVNSSLYAHNGTHPSAFTLNTSSITNNGGTFYGLNDGNGNINVHVTGNFYNYGSVKIINNTGMAGVSNGDASFTVDSAYFQSGGDTRIIYNVSTTNSGLLTASFRDIILTGGIFMAQSGCRTSGGICSMTVLQNLNINFPNTTDKFRGTSISSIGASTNKVQFNLVVGGSLTIAGSLNAEFTSSASAGNETVTVNGSSAISGCNVSFNYGALSSSHASTLTMNGNVSITGGMTYLSRNNGPAAINFNGNYTQSAGQMTIKGGDSTATVTIAGNYNQTGGQIYIHNNSTAPATTTSSLVVLGTYNQTSGTFSFDSNSSNTSADHQLVINGSGYTIGGNSIINRAGAGSSTSYGKIIYNRKGIINYSRNSSNITLSQVKQFVTNSSTLRIASGNLLVSSTPQLINYMLNVEKGGTLDMTGNQIVSNGVNPFSSFYLDSNATLITRRVQGLYNGTANSCISTGITFVLNPTSTIEYNGNANQVVTGNFAGVIPVTNQYGILKINMQGMAGAQMNFPVSVRTKLILANGELNLAGNILTIGTGASSAIVRTNGYINGELSGGITAGTVIWKNMNFGLHEFPFGTNASTYLPVKFYFVGGNATDVSVSTYSASTNDNLPLPLYNNIPVSFASGEANFPVTDIIDRWWVINAPGVMAGLVVAYAGSENTISSAYQNGQIGFVSWTGTEWATPSSSGVGTVTGIGIVSAEEISDLSILTVGRQTGLRVAGSIRSLTAEQIGADVSITWSTEMEQNSDYFIVERSTDGNTFEEIANKKASGNSSSVLKYSIADPNPVEGKSYYRIRQISKDRTSSSSSIETLIYSLSNHSGISIESAGPNPFESSFKVNYTSGTDGLIMFELSSSSGQLIYQAEEYNSKGMHTFNYSEGDKLQTGIYFLKIIAGDKSVNKKLMRK